MVENVKLRNDATDLSAEVERQRKTISDFTAECDKLKGSVKKLGLQLSQLQETASKLGQNNKMMEQEIKDQTNYIEKVHSNCDRLGSENTQLKKHHDEAMKENASLWEQNRTLKSQLNEAHGAIEELNNVIHGNQEQINGLIPENESLRQFTNEIQEKFYQVEEENKKLIQDQDILKAQNAIKLQGAIEESKRLSDELAKAKSDNEKLKVPLHSRIGRNPRHPRQPEGAQRGTQKAQGNEDEERRRRTQTKETGQECGVFDNGWS